MGVFENDTKNIYNVKFELLFFTTLLECKPTYEVHIQPCDTMLCCLCPTEF